jgi:hypothetical protein
MTHLTPEKIDAALAGLQEWDFDLQQMFEDTCCLETIRAALELAKTVTEKQLNPPITVYGYCPKCGAMGKMRERRIGGDDICFNGHRYPSRTSLPNQPIGYKND